MRKTHFPHTVTEVIPANRDHGRTEDHYEKVHPRRDEETARLQALAERLGGSKGTRRPAACRGGAADFTERYAR